MSRLILVYDCQADIPSVPAGCLPVPTPMEDNIVIDIKIARISEGPPACCGSLDSIIRIYEMLWGRGGWLLSRKDILVCEMTTHLRA